MNSDGELVGRLREGDAHAFETLLNRYEEMIRRHLWRYVRDEAAAQDLLQEVFMRVWTRSTQWDGRGSFKAWLYRIATNLALNHLRTVRRRREEPLVITDSWEDDDDDSSIPAWMIDVAALGPDVAVEIAEERRTLRTLIDELPAGKREVFRLVHEMEMSMRDAAAVLEIPEGTVKSRLYYARKELASAWNHNESE
jgi:RNA polymerase sigma-70 factor (ECF subfamily)